MAKTLLTNIFLFFFFLFSFSNHKKKTKQKQNDFPGAANVDVDADADDDVDPFNENNRKYREHSDEYTSYYAYDDSEQSAEDFLQVSLTSELPGQISRDRRIVVDSDGRYICECGKTYKEERYMRHHQRWECGKLPSFHCPYCKYMAKRKNSLKSHIQRRHNSFNL